MKLPFSSRFGIIAFIIYIVFIGGATYGATNLFIHGIQLILMTVLVIEWITNLIRHQEAFPRTVLDFPILAYVAWLGITTILSTDWRVSLEQSWQLIIHIFILYILVDYYRRGREQVFFEGLFLIAALVVVISIAELLSWYFGLGFGGLNNGWFAIGGLSDPIPAKGYRLTLAFNVATWLGNFVIQVLPIIIAWSITAKKVSDRQALRLVGAGLVGVLALSASRGAILGLLAGIGIWILLYAWQKGAFTLLQQRRYAIAASILTILFVIAGVGFVLILSQGRGSGDQGRITLWEGAQDILQNHPLTGTGVYQFGYALREVKTLNGSTDHLKTAHNLYLNTAAEIGFTGLLLMVWFAGMFLWGWWQAWQVASAKRQIRLIAALAAIGGFCVQSLVDTFTFTSTLLPILMIAAYVLAEPQPSKSRRLMQLYAQYAVIVVVLVYGVWMLRSDFAQFRLFQSTIALADHDLETALEDVEAAQNIDPHLRLYELERAYFLGRLAEDNPNDYLQIAIDTYQTALQDDPAFHIGHLNLAALYAQREDYENALAAAQQAHALRPDLWLYNLKIAEYQEALGMEDQAIDSYTVALLQSPLFPAAYRDYTVTLSTSNYWNPENPIQVAALDAAYESYALAPQLIFAIQRGWEDRAETVATQLEPVATQNLDFAALGYYAAFRGETEQAVNWYEKAGNIPWVHTELANIYFAQGDTNNAQKHARTATFLDSREGIAANYVLAKIQLLETDPNNALINQLLIDSVQPRFVVQSYGDVVFGHIALLDYLPQVNIPGSGEASFEPWFLLADRYAADSDDETDPIKVYETILEIDPYVEQARVLCGENCME